MNVVSRAEFARIVGVARSSITIIVRNGKLPSVDGNIDLDDPEVQRYMDLRKGSLKARGKNGTGRPVYRMRADSGDSPDEAGDEDLTDEEKSRIASLVGGVGSKASPSRASEQSEYDGTLQKIKVAELTNKQIKNAKDKIFYDELTKKIVVFEAAARAFNSYQAALRQNFGLFDQQHADQIYDAVLSQKTRVEVMAIIRGFVEVHLRDTQAAASAAIERLRENT